MPKWCEKGDEKQQMYIRDWPRGVVGGGFKSNDTYLFHSKDIFSTGIETPQTTRKRRKMLTEFVQNWIGLMQDPRSHTWVDTAELKVVPKYADKRTFLRVAIWKMHRNYMRIRVLSTNYVVRKFAKLHDIRYAFDTPLRSGHAVSCWQGDHAHVQIHDISKWCSAEEAASCTPSRYSRL